MTRMIFPLCSLEADPHRATPFLWDDEDRGDVLDAERRSATETGQPRNLRSSMVHDRTLLAQRALETHVSYGGS